MGSWQQKYIDKYYSRAPEWKDIHTLWNELLEDHVPRGARALEIGRGPANDASVFLAIASATLLAWMSSVIRSVTSGSMNFISTMETAFPFRISTSTLLRLAGSMSTCRIPIHTAEKCFVCWRQEVNMYSGRRTYAITWRASQALHHIGFTCSQQIVLETIPPIITSHGLPITGSILGDELALLCMRSDLKLTFSR